MIYADRIPQMSTIFLRPDQLQTGPTTVNKKLVDIFTKLHIALRDNINKCSVYAVTSDGISPYKYNSEFKTFLLESLDTHGVNKICGLVINDQKHGTAWSYYRYRFVNKPKVIYNTEAFGLPHTSCEWIVIGEQERVDYDAHTKTYVLSGCKRLLVVSAMMF